MNDSIYSGPVIPLRELTRRYVLRVYAHCNFMPQRTARALGIGRTTLYRLLKKYGVKR